MDSEEFEGALDAVKQGENNVVVGTIFVGHLGDLDQRDPLEEDGYILQEKHRFHRG